MFDKAYFRSGLQAQIDAAGAEPTVEVHLVNGQGHRIRSVIEAADGYVVLEAYQRRTELTGSKGRWHGRGDAEAAANESHRAVISYHAISQIVITPTDSSAEPRIGFNAR